MRFIDFKKYILSPRPDSDIIPVRIIDKFGKQLSNSAKLIRKLSVKDGIYADMKDTYVVDFGKYVAGRYKQIGGETIGCGDFPDPIRYTLSNNKWSAFRYVKVSGKVDYLGVRVDRNVSLPIGPDDYKGKFLCSDNLLNEIWYSAAYTVQLCAMRNKKTEKGRYEFFDGPKRDRRLFLWFDSAGNETFYYVFNNMDVAKTSYDYVLNHGKDGNFVTRDTPDPIVIDVSGFTEADLWELYNYSGDLDYLRKFYPEPINTHIKKQVLPRRVKNGLYSCNLMIPVGPNFELSMPNQAYVYRGLISAAKIAEIFGDNNKKNYYKKRAEELKEAVNKHLWSSTKGAYVFSEGAEHVDQLGNSLAIILDLPDKERAEKILQYFKDHHWRLYHWKKGKKGWGKYNPAGSTDFDRPWLAGDNDFNPSFKSWAWDINPDNFSNCGNYNYCISPYCIGWEIEAHFKIGQDKDALDLTRRCFGNMVKKGPGTFWEHIHYSGKSGYELALAGKRIRSACHRWSGKIGAVLSKYILGIKAAEPGFKKVSIIPYIGDLSWAQGQITTNYGEIKVCWEKTLKSFAEDISIPQCCKGLFALPKPVNQVYINKRLVWDKGKFFSIIPEIKNTFQDTNYVYFDVIKGGKYQLSGKLK